jgi:hypothetical protein
MLNMSSWHAHNIIARNRQKPLPKPKTLVTLSHQHMHRREPTVLGASKVDNEASHLVSYSIVDVQLANTHNFGPFANVRGVCRPAPTFVRK